jgi:hypothetical protein
VGSSIEGSCLPHCRFVAAVPHSAADALLLRHEAVLLAAIVPIVIPFDHGARGGSCAALGGALTRAALGSHLPNAEHIADGDALLNVPEVPTEDRCSALATLASTAAATALLRRRAGGVSAAAAASLARHATTTSELRRKTTIKMTFRLHTFFDSSCARSGRSTTQILVWSDFDSFASTFDFPQISHTGKCQTLRRPTRHEPARGRASSARGSRTERGSDDADHGANGAQLLKRKVQSSTDNCNCKMCVCPVMCMCVSVR